MLKLFVLCSMLPVVALALGAPHSQAVGAGEGEKASDSVQATVSYTSGDIKAGEDFEFTIKLDKAPNFTGGSIVATFSPVNGQGSASGGSATKPGETVYHVKATVPIAAAGGTWRLTDLQFWNSAAWVNLPHNEISFRVIPTPGIVYPTSGEVTVNLNQVQLLRREAGRLQERIQKLKSAVSEYLQAEHEGPFNRY